MEGSGGSARVTMAQSSEASQRNVRPLVIAGPSGAGKSTLIKQLKAEFPGAFGLCVSHTTRNIRPGEEDGVHYHFIDRDTHAKMVADDAFLEHAEYSGNLYGTSKSALQDVVGRGLICLLDIDMQGVRSVKRYAQENKDLRPAFVFIQPTDLAELEQRLISRGEQEESRALRLETARGELEAAQEPGLFDRIVVNANGKFDEGYAALRGFVLEVNPWLEQSAE